MNINRKVIKIELEGKEFDFILDFESAMEFQSAYGKSIFIGLQKVSEEQDLLALGCLMASALKDQRTGKAIGIDVVGKFDLLSSLEPIMECLGELVDNSLPTETDDNKKK